MGAAETLAAYLGDVPATDANVAACATEAEALVSRTLARLDGTATPVPAEIRARAVTEVGAELWNRRTLRNGLAVFGQGDGDLAPVRVARDPLHMARAILAPWLGGPFS